MLRLLVIDEHIEQRQALRIALEASLGFDASVICAESPDQFSDAEAEHYSATLRNLSGGLPVEFTGWQEDVNAILAQLDLLVVPSLREPGAPRVVLEAFAAHVPAVAFVSGGIPELVIQGKTGFLVEPPTAEALAVRLASLLDAPNESRDVAGRAYQTWSEKFTRERYQREVLEVIGLTQTRSATGRSI